MTGTILTSLVHDPMSSTEWVLFNVNDNTFHPLTSKTTIGDEDDCDIRLRETNIKKDSFKFTIRANLVFFCIQNKSNKYKISLNNTPISSNYYFVRANHYLQIKTYRLKIIKSNLFSKNLSVSQREKLMKNITNLEKKIENKSEIVKPTAVPIPYNTSKPLFNLNLKHNQLPRGFTNGKLTIETENDEKIRKLFELNSEFPNIKARVFEKTTYKGFKFIQTFDSK